MLLHHSRLHSFPWRLIWAMSSGLDWVDAGGRSDDHQPEARLMLMPFAATKELYKRILEKSQMEKDAAAAAKAVDVEVAGVANREGSPTAEREKRQSRRSKRRSEGTSANQQSAGSVGGEKEQSETSPDKSSPTRETGRRLSIPTKAKILKWRRQSKVAADLGEFQASSARCWLSQSFSLLPGHYMVFADVTCLPETDLNRTRNLQREEECWRTNSEPLPDNKTVYVQVSGTSPFTLRYAVPPKPVEIPLASRNRRLQAKSFKTLSFRAPSSPFHPDSSISGRARSPKQPVSRSVTPDLSSIALAPKKEAGEADSNEVNGRSMGRSGDSLRGYDLQDAGPGLSHEEIRDILRNNSVKGVLVDEERWPFAIENQQEVSSRGALDLLARLRTDANLLSAEVLSRR